MGLGATYHSQPHPKSAPQVAQYRSQPWYEASMAALFESDRAQIEQKIRKATQLILFRERELLGERDDLSEHRALNNALHALQALQMCMRSRS